MTGAPSIRFYAGYPLSTSNGEKPGSLCVVDCVPRKLDDNQQRAMQVLGRQVMVQMELKQQLDALHAALQQKQLAEVALQSSQRMLESANTQLLRQSLTDPLTGLGNRRAFEIALDREFQRSRRSKAPLSLLMLDIDFFKSFNDTYGHVQGDEVLRRIGSLIRACSRESDMTARYGGEEFVIILPDTTGEQALHLAARLGTAISTDVWNLRQITVSIGVATLDADTPTHYALVNAADQALYRAKSSGKNCVCAFNPKMYPANPQTACPTCLHCQHLKRRGPFNMALCLREERLLLQNFFQARCNRIHKRPLSRTHSGCGSSRMPQYIAT